MTQPAWEVESPARSDFDHWEVESQPAAQPPPGNILEAIGRGVAATANSGIPGEGTVTPEQTTGIHGMAQGIEGALGQQLTDLLPTPRPENIPVIPEDVRNLSEAERLRLGMAVQPAGATGADIAHDILSRKTARTLAEAGGGFAATLPFGGEGVLPAAGRIAAAVLGGASGSLASETFDPTANPLTTAAYAGGAQALGQGFGETILGGARLLKTEDTGNKMLSDFMDGFLKSSSKADAAELLSGALKDEKGLRSAIYGAGMDAIDNYFGKGAIVSLANIKREAARMFAESQAGVGSGAEQRLLEEIMAKPDAVNFRDAARLRSTLNAVKGGEGESGVVASGYAEGAAKHLAEQLGTDMEGAAKSLGSDSAYKLYRAVSDQYREGSEVFNGRVGRAIASKNPEVYFDAAIRTNSATGISKLRDVIHDPQAWSGIQGQAVKEIVDKATDVHGRIDGDALLRAVKPGGTFGDEKFAAVFSPRELETFRKAAGTIAKGQANGGLAITALAGGTALLGHPFAGGAIFLGKGQLQKLFTNRIAVAALTKAAEIPLSSPRSVQAFSQLAAAVTHSLASDNEEDTRQDAAQSIPPSELTPP